jgi:hypothetical protein
MMDLRGLAMEGVDVERERSELARDRPYGRSEDVRYFCRKRSLSMIARSMARLG